ncbi:unnamed protein product, partial [Mesorhabditis spiculigera]
MDEKYVTSTWELLKKAIQEIQNKNNSGLSFEELYRNAYTMVLHKHGERLYNGLRSVIEEHLKNKVRQRISSCQEGGLLVAVIMAWSDHTTAMVMIRDILMYMDRVYVTNQEPPIEPVYNLGLSIFKDEVVRWDFVNEKLREEMLLMIAAERNGETIPWSQLKQACAMLSALGIYETEFENQFLHNTSDYYKKLSDEFLKGNSAADFVNKVTRCLEEEAVRADRYLEPGTARKVLNVVELELIKANMQYVANMQGTGVAFMLNMDHVEDLHNMFKLFTRVTGGPMVICTAASAWLREKGEQITTPCEGNEVRADPVEYITKLMELGIRCKNLLTKAFCKDIHFKRMVCNEFAAFINKNPRSPEFLAAYLDEKLKKGNRVLKDKEIDEALDSCMVLFRYLADKDIFEHYYKRFLAKRLLNERSSSDDSEKAMVGRLKLECGYQYTSKLESMFKDREIWLTAQTGFKEHQSASREVPGVDPCDIQVRVLTSGVWPTPVSTMICTLPLAADVSYKGFSEYYLKQHNGRRLTLNTYLGNAEVKAIFYNTPKSAVDEPMSSTGPSPKRPSRVNESSKILCVSTHQMAVLMLFNAKEVITCAEIASATNINDKELQRTLQSLSMGKASQRVLVRNGAATKDIEESDEFYVNDQFTSKLVRVKISTILDTKVANQKETVEVKEKVEDDRKHEIECAIVRIMKSRKELDHSNLVSEVVRQIEARFKPPLTVIKQRIEALIEREYLQRNKDDAKVYQYLA